MTHDPVEAALAAYANVEPRPGLEGRVLARLAEPRRRLWWWLVALAPVPAALAFWMLLPPRLTLELPRPPAPRSVALTVPVPRPAPPAAAVAAASAKRAVFPAPAPLSAEERALLTLSANRPDVLARPALEPLVIEPLSIAPLSSGSTIQ
jgi:hypothetical protein